MNEIEVMEFLTNIGKAAKEASMTVSHLGQLKKNKVLVDAANLLVSILTIFSPLMPKIFRRQKKRICRKDFRIV